MLKPTKNCSNCFNFTFTFKNNYISVNKMIYDVLLVLGGTQIIAFTNLPTLMRGKGQRQGLAVGIMITLNNI